MEVGTALLRVHTERQKKRDWLTRNHYMRFVVCVLPVLSTYVLMWAGFVILVGTKFLKVSPGEHLNLTEFPCGDLSACREFVKNN